MSAITGLQFELLFWPGGTSPSIVSFTLNQTTDQLEWIFQAPEAITITRLGFRQTTLTGVAPVFKVSLQGVDGSGNPDGTIKGGGSPASVSYTPTSGNNSSWVWVTLDNAYTCARGEMLSMVIAYLSGTIDGSNSCSFVISNAASRSPGVPYGIQNDAGSRTRSTAASVFGYGSSTTAYGLPDETVAGSAFGPSSTPDEKAVLFNIPTGWWSSHKVVGAVVYFQSIPAGGTYDLVLYDTDGTTVLQSVSMDSDTTRSTGAVGTAVFFDESSLATLNAGSSYRLAVVPTSGTTSTLTLPSFTVDASADMAAYLGGGTVAQGSTRTNAGAWTDDPLTRFGINPILADITAPVGGGTTIYMMGEG